MWCYAMPAAFAICAQKKRGNLLLVKKPIKQTWQTRAGGCVVGRRGVKWLFASWIVLHVSAQFAFGNYLILALRPKWDCTSNMPAGYGRLRKT